MPGAIAYLCGSSSVSVNVGNDKITVKIRLFFGIAGSVEEITAIVCLF